MSTVHIRVGARALVIEDGAVLLVEFDDESGVHYNLPGGGVEAGESVVEALVREAMEEACAIVEVGPLAFVVEYEPVRNGSWAGDTHKLSLIFHCRLAGGSAPRMPDRPDPYQTAVRWVPLDHLESVELLPHLAGRIVACAAGGPGGAVYLEEPLEID